MNGKLRTVLFRHYLSGRRHFLHHSSARYDRAGTETGALAERKTTEKFRADNPERSGHPKFRHDFSNHLICLEELARNGESERVKDYIQEMQQRLKQIRESVYDVHNAEMNAILNYYLPTIKEEQNADILVSGSAANCGSFSPMALCTVLSNLIQNAAEELERQTGKQKYIKVRFYVDKGNLIIEVENSSGYMTPTDRIPPTVKPDTRNHGLGLQNVQEVTECYDGKLRVKQRPGTFLARVTLPIPPQT